MMIDSCKVYRCTLTGFGAINALACGLHAAYAQLLPAWKEFYFVFGGNMATNRCAGDHAAEALYGKCAINWQAEVTALSRATCWLARPAPASTRSGLFRFSPTGTIGLLQKRSPRQSSSSGTS
jgi:hypothetical protein